MNWQKIKWEFLAKLNPYYYIWSIDRNQDEQSFRESGKLNVSEQILNDHLLTDRFDFKNSTILEIGCGAGRMTEFIVENFKQIYAYDISEIMVGIAKKRLANFNNIVFFKSGGHALEIKDDTIDIAFSYIVFQHMPTKKMILNSLNEIYRVLRKGGVAKIQMRGKKARGGILRFFMWYYGVNFTKQSIKNLLNKTAFTLLKTSSNNEKYLWIYLKK